MEVYLIRHPQVAIDSNVCYGQSDVPLTDRWADEVKWIQAHCTETFDAVFMSPSSRCSKLAEHIQAAHYFVDHRLLELNFGDWELKRWDQIEPQTLAIWMKDYVHYQIPGGESFAQLHDRTTIFFDSLMATDFKRVAVVTHAGVIRSLIAGILEIPLANVFRISVDYASLSKIVVKNQDKGWSIEFINLCRGIDQSKVK